MIFLFPDAGRMGYILHRHYGWGKTRAAASRPKRPYVFSAERGHSCPPQRRMLKRIRRILSRGHSRVAADRNVSTPLNRYKGFFIWLTTACLSLFIDSALPAELKLQPFFPQGATVVLIAGLPGDIESENVYREE